ncbi:hypothetical protein NL676_011903 [Syzygium grande]|nr:hypothetical protein NL676_011903 [Syzygium grande]
MHPTFREDNPMMPRTRKLGAPGSQVSHWLFASNPEWGYKDFTPLEDLQKQAKGLLYKAVLIVEVQSSSYQLSKLASNEGCIHIKLKSSFLRRRPDRRNQSTLKTSSRDGEAGTKEKEMLCCLRTLLTHLAQWVRSRCFHSSQLKDGFLDLFQRHTPNNHREKVLARGLQ